MREIVGTIIRTLDRPDGPVSWGILTESGVVRLHDGDRVVADNGNGGLLARVTNAATLWYLLAADDGTLTILDLFDGCAVRLLEAADSGGSVTDGQAEPPLIRTGPGGDFVKEWP